MKFSLFIPKDAKLSKTWLIFFAVNFLIMGAVRYVEIPMPTSLFVEIFYLICIIGSLISSEDGNISRLNCAMLGFLAPWLIYSFVEIGNASSEIPYVDIISRWFAEIRIMAFQVLYGMLICAAIFTKKEQVKTMYKIWGIFVIAATLNTLKQQYIGFDAGERAFLVTAARTHFVNGIIRYFSFFSDAATYGCNMAATCAVFAAVTLSCKKKKEKIYFAIISCCALYGMLASGTRTGVFVLGVGAFVYACCSKKTTAIVTTLIVGGIFFAFLKFTVIGQGNSMIRRMRSAFKKDDASMTVREINQQAMQRYIDELPLGLGAGIRNGDVPPSNKNYYLSVVPPDSTWVYVDIHYGHLGKLIFLFSFIGMGAMSGIILFKRVKDPELRGLLAGITCGEAAMVVAGYGNQIMLQYPNCYLFFGQLIIVYMGPDIERRELEAQAKRDKELLTEEEITAIEEEKQNEEEAIEASDKAMPLTKLTT